MAKLVSKTYGDALFEVALEKNQLDEFLDEVKAAQTAIEENKELFKLMSHPKIVKESSKNNLNIVQKSPQDPTFDPIIAPS